MKSLTVWMYIIGAVSIALLGNSISAMWAKGESLFSVWLLALLLISPLVFLSFGFVTSRLGLANTSATVDSLLTFSTIAVGLFLFQEWNKVSFLQYLGMFFALLGVFFMVSFPLSDS